MISILYVDDEPALLEITKLFLERSGDFIVNVAESVQTGLSMLAAIGVDAIISDYQMPGTDGITFLKKVRASGNTIPFIIFTGKGREEIASEALNSGADFYIQKGGDPKSQFIELSYKIQQAVRRNRAEKALKISEARFRDFFERADDLIAILSPSGTFQYVNDTWCRVLEYSKDESYALSFLTILAPDKKDETGTLFDNFLKGKESFNIITVFVSRTGRRIPVECSFSVQTDGENIISLQGIFRDVSEQEKIQGELVESKRMLTTLMDNLPGMTYRCRNDRDWTMEFVSGGCAVLTGYSSDELIGNRRIAFNDLILPEYQNRVWEKWQEILKDHTVFHDEYAIKTATGQIKWVWEQGRGVYSPSGDVLALEGYIIDITERKQIEKILRESERNYREIFDATNEAISIDEISTGRLIDVNMRMLEMYGYSQKKEILERTIGDLSAGIPPYTQSEAIEYIKKTLTDGPQVFEWQAKTKTGETFWVEMSLQRSQIGGQDRILAVVRDMTGRKCMEQSLQQMNKKLKILSSTTRHDINNKLTILSGYSGLVKEMVPDEKIQSFVGIQENAIADISKILKFTKEYEQLGVEMPTWLTVQTVLSSAISEIQIKPLTFSDTTKGLQVFADSMFERVFYHLIDNIIRHAASATAVQVGYTVSNGDCVIWIKDDGPGILPENKEKIFQRGFGKNTGLGLFISREILAITNLEIHETGEFGKGACFEIRIPKGKFKVAGHQ
ncbi:MAG: PAS domain S-box protein [Methanoregula sp.]|jgi:PAS domain S-box-containing protein